jgi:hypothetical protein
MSAHLLAEAGVLGTIQDCTPVRFGPERPPLPHRQVGRHTLDHHHLDNHQRIDESRSNAQPGGMP